MDPADAVAATTGDDDAEVVRAIRAAANGALDAHFFYHGERTSPLQWRGVSADPTSGRVTELALKADFISLPAVIGRLTALRSLTLKQCTNLATLPPELSGRGFTLVPISAQLEPCLTHKNTLNTP
jgi:hypothetical protein